jgi:hypothetical protein
MHRERRSVPSDVFAAANSSSSCLLRRTTQLTAVAASACKVEPHLKMQGVVTRLQGLRWGGTQGHQVLQIGHVHHEAHLQHVVHRCANTDWSSPDRWCMPLATAPLWCGLSIVRGIAKLTCQEACCSRSGSTNAIVIVKGSESSPSAGCTSTRASAAIAQHWLQRCA